MQKKNIEIGSKIRVSLEYFLEQDEIITKAPYGEVVDMFDNENVTYIDYKGNCWNVDRRYCEEDNIDSLEIAKEDPEEVRKIKSIMQKIDSSDMQAIDKEEAYDENLDSYVMELLIDNEEGYFSQKLDVVRAIEKYKEIVKSQYEEKRLEENLSEEDLTSIETDYKNKVACANFVYKTIDYTEAAEVSKYNRENEKNEIQQPQQPQKLQQIQLIMPQTGSAAGKDDPMNYFEDMIEKAKLGEYDRAIERENEIGKVVETLCKRNKKNGILVGKQGCGKSAIMQEIAMRVAAGEIKALEGKKILSLDIEGLLAGTKYRGEFEEKVKNVLDFCKKDKDVIMFIDEIHKIMGAGGNVEGGMDLGNMLKTSLLGGISVIGATTCDEYKRISKDAALERRFGEIRIEEKDAEFVKRVLKEQKVIYENYHKVKTSDLLLDAIINTFDQKNNNTSNIDYAKDTLDDICSKMKVNEASEAESYKKFMLEQTYNREETNEYVKKATCGFATESEDKAKTELELTGLSKEYYDKLVSLENLDKEIEAESLVLAEVELNNTITIKEKEFAGLEA